MIAALKSPLVRWHARHVALIWFGVRMLVLAALSMPSLAPDAVPGSPLNKAAGPIATVVSFVVVMIVTEIDRRRIGAPLLFANLGYSARWRAVSTGALVIALELLLQVAVRTIGSAE